MKYILSLFFVVIGSTLNAQTIDYNTKKGFAVEGYDIVSYFSNIANKGSDKYVVSYDSVKYKFSSQSNLDTFNKNPEMYLPQYGGYCAYAVAIKAKKVQIDPETFEIRNNKLYLFYNSWGTNTLNSWNKESPDNLKLVADKNWQRIGQEK